MLTTLFIDFFLLYKHKCLYSKTIKERKSYNDCLKDPKIIKVKIRLRLSFNNDGVRYTDKPKNKS